MNKAEVLRTSSPSLIELPPQPGRRTRSPALTDGGTTFPCLLGAPGPTAMTVASGRGEVVAEEGRKIPDAVFYDSTLEYFCTETRDEVRTVSGLKRWTRTRSRSGTTALIDLKVIWAACIIISTGIVTCTHDTHHCDVVEEQRNFGQLKFAPVCSKKKLLRE